MNEPCPRSTAAFLDLMDTLRAAHDVYLGPAHGVDAGMDRLEGLRYLLHLVSAGIDLYLESDAERPHFTRMVSPTRKFGGDNPDDKHGKHTYRFADTGLDLFEERHKVMRYQEFFGVRSEADG